MAKGAQFRQVNTPRPRRNLFDLSHERRLSADLFKLYPVLVEDCIPGDKWQISNELIIRMNPLLAPIMHEINATVHYFFVPYRILWAPWEDYLNYSRGNASATVRTRPGAPTVIPTLPKMFASAWGNAECFAPGSITDHLYGFTYNSSYPSFEPPMLFPYWAYLKIYDEFYRDQNLTTEVFTGSNDIYNTAVYDGLLVRCWEKDYFTSSLPWQQAGVSPALPISGVTSAIFNGTVQTLPDSQAYPSGQKIRFTATPTNFQEIPVVNALGDNSSKMMDFFNNNTVSLANATTFDVSDLRLAFQTQKWLERDARTGGRYIEVLRAHFGVFPRDERLQRPEYIGGSKQPIIISEVLQTSQTTQSSSPNGASQQGNMSGHGISADRTFVASYNVKEHGVILGLMSIMPRTMYQQGCNRMWLRNSNLEFYWHEFQNLSEQAITQSEIFNAYPPTGVPDEKPLLGYIGRYDEYRFRANSVHGLFKSDFNFWHLGRIFSTPPTLNTAFVRPTPIEQNAMKRALIVQNQPMFMCTLGHRIRAIRPMNWMAQPGLIDHN